MAKSKTNKILLVAGVAVAAYFVINEMQKKNNAPQLPPNMPPAPPYPGAENQPWWQNLLNIWATSSQAYLQSGGANAWGGNTGGQGSLRGEYVY